MRRRARTGDDETTGTPGATETELDGFARAMADVVPLSPDPRGRVRAAPPVAGPPATVSPGPASRDADDDDVGRSGFVAPGVDRREIRRLKRGDYAPGSRLDLHGQTAAEAVASLTRFIDLERRRHRCVCVVHGRGLHSAGNRPVLKTRVRACLRQHRAVLAYADAPPADGGDGAVYVLLRK